MARVESLTMEATRMAPLRQLHTPSATLLRGPTAPRSTLRRASSVVVTSKLGKDIAPAGAVAAASWLAAAPAFAATGTEEFAKQLQSKLDSAQALSEQLGAAGSEAAKLAKTAADAAKPAVEYATPYVKKAASDAVTTASPYLREGASTVEKTVTSTLKSSGVDLDAAASASKVATDAAGNVVSALTTATPVAKSFLQSASASLDPQTQTTLIGAGVLFVLLTPVWGPALATKLRGYAGDINAASSLVTLAEGSMVMIDVRSAEEAAARGGPQLPSGANKIIAVPLVTVVDKRLRGQMSGASSVEVDSTAVVIASLKKVNKKTTILLMDRNGSNSKKVAMALARRGFKNAFVLEGGFEGRGGWKQSSLASTAGTGVQSGSGSFKILGTGRFGGTGSVKVLGSGSQKQKALRQ